MDCILVTNNDGIFTPVPDAPSQIWEDVIYDCDSYEHIDKITGWGKFTDCYKVIDNGKTLFYFVEMPIW